MTPNESHECYLGLPAFVGRSKKRVFDGGNGEILIKAVAHATSTYVMKVFKIPQNLCMTIQPMIARFWWGGKHEEHRIHWISWDRMSRGKVDGGMGFRKVSCFNQARLAKQGWRIISRLVTFPPKF